MDHRIIQDYSNVLRITVMFSKAFYKQRMKFKSDSMEFDDFLNKFEYVKSKDSMHGTNERNALKHVCKATGKIKPENSIE